MSQKQQKIARMIEIITTETDKQLKKINDEAILQANHDANKIQVEMAKKAEIEFSNGRKQVEVEDQVRHSQSVTQLRMKVLLQCDALLQQCKLDAFRRAQERCDPSTLARLVRQSCDSLQVDECVVQCPRGSFERIQQEAQGFRLTCHEQPLSEDLGGGVICYTLDGRTFIDNTIKKRVELACQSLAPRLSGILFDADASCLW